MGLIKTAGKVAVASSVHGRVQRRQQQRWAAQDSATAAVPPSSPAGDPHSTQLAQLSQLGELRAAGVLTEAEFQAKKAAILRS
jgi:hypothetical protein